MKVCIFIKGMNEAFNKQTVSSYASRLKNEIEENSLGTGIKYVIKQENLLYESEENSRTNCVSIVSQREGKEDVLYKFYEFEYTSILRENYNGKSVFIKSLLLAVVIARKLPLVFMRLFKRSGTGYFMLRMRLQAMYAIVILGILGLSGFLLLPSVVAYIVELMKVVSLNEVFKNDPRLLQLTQLLKLLSHVILALSALLIALVPASKDFITSLGTEFVCVHNYLESGDQKQAVFGQLDKLVDYIYEKEGGDAQLQFHAYSFGCIIALDFLFPYASTPALRLVAITEALVTIGCPYEFISTYYANYFDERDSSLAKKLEWYNVFSKSDALSSNFRRDARYAKAEYSFGNNGNIPVPINLYYEITPRKKFYLVDFVLLYFLRAHSFYWDGTPASSSCERLIYLAQRTNTHAAQL
ncbi:MAG TPA: hypothetical protein VHE34_09515 [Puia sp.]|uniref:hypothetical protein n=1 Tax=Puia sp. TaxID=2045100 RepID=UPI002D044832|nr:hypothetical protein [Puia sp.]HVU95452.1 hypothetical protein [Puia sp.]